jgi:hypothetical protein
VHLGIERQHHGRVVGGRIGMRQAAADRPAVPHLRIADGPRRRRPARRTARAAGRRGDVVVDGRRADLDPAVHLANAGEARDAGDVDEHAAR